MAKHRMDDGTILDTEKASQSWDEDRYHDGRNLISKATNDQWTHQKLYRSRKGRYYIVHTSQWQGSRDHAEFVSPEEAARWLMLMSEDLPDDLKQYADEIVE